MTADQLPAALRERDATEIAWLVKHGFDEFNLIGSVWYAENGSYGLCADFPTDSHPEWGASDYVFDNDDHGVGAAPSEALVAFARHLRAASAKALTVAAKIDALLA